MEQDSGWGISGFRISIQSLIKENCHNSRTNDDVEIKLGPATRVDKINKTTNKIFGDDLMSEDCDVNTIFTTNLGKSGSRIRDAEPGKLIFLLIITLYLTKT